MVLALHTITGRTADVSPKTLQHPHFSKFLVPVEDGTKPYAPELYKPGTAEEKEEANKNLKKRKKALKKVWEAEDAVNETLIEEDK